MADTATKEILDDDRMADTKDAVNSYLEKKKPIVK